MSPNELASVAEIATILAVPKRTAARWVNRPDFPAPIDVLEVGRIWSRADLEAWATSHLPLKRGTRPAE